MKTVIVTIYGVFLSFLLTSCTNRNPQSHFLSTTTKHGSNPRGIITVDQVSPGAGEGIFPDMESKVTPPPADSPITVALPSNAGVKTTLSLTPPCMNLAGFRLHPLQADCDGFLRTTFGLGPVMLIYNSGRSDINFFGAKGVTHSFDYHIERVNSTQYYLYTPFDRMELAVQADGTLKFRNSLYGRDVVFTVSPDQSSITHQLNDETTVFRKPSGSTQYWIHSLTTRWAEITYTYQTISAGGAYPALTAQISQVRMRDLTNRNPESTTTFQMNNGAPSGVSLSDRYVNISVSPVPTSGDPAVDVSIYDQGLSNLKAIANSEMAEFTLQRNSAGRSFPVQIVTKKGTQVTAVSYYGLDNAGHLSFVQEGDEWANVTYPTGTDIHYVNFRDRYGRDSSWRGYRSIGGIYLPIWEGTPLGAKTTTFSATFPHEITAVWDPRYGTSTVTRPNTSTFRVTGPTGSYIESVKSGTTTTVTDNTGRRIAVTQAVEADGPKQTVVSTFGTKVLTQVAKFFNSGDVDVTTTGTAATKQVVNQKVLVDATGVSSNDLISGHSLREETTDTSAIRTFKQGEKVVIEERSTKTEKGYVTEEKWEGVTRKRREVIIDPAVGNRVSTASHDPASFGVRNDTRIDLPNKVTTKATWFTLPTEVASKEKNKWINWASIFDWLKFLTWRAKAEVPPGSVGISTTGGETPCGCGCPENPITCTPKGESKWQCSSCNSSCGDGGGSFNPPWGVCCYNPSTHTCVDGGWEAPPNVFTCPSDYRLDGLNGQYSKCSLSNEGTCFRPDGAVRPLKLTVTKAGTGSGTVSAPGIDCGSDCNEYYDPGTEVFLTATAAAGSVFAGWSGGGCSGTGQCHVTMSAAVTVTATFNTVTMFNLAVSKSGTGSGTVTASPGISCGADCSEAYIQGSIVPLTAAPTTGSTFGGWSGCAGDPITPTTCTVAMTSNVNVTATFNVLTYNLQLTKVGSGNVTFNPSSNTSCGTNCKIYNHGVSVILTAAPSAGYQFSGWSGACTGTTSTCTVTMTAARNVTATFIQTPISQYRLTVTKAGTGAGTVTGPGGINCGTNGATCTADFNSGTSVALSKTVGASSIFTGWSGACSGTGSCSLTMTQPQGVTATFVACGASDQVCCAGNTCADATLVCAPDVLGNVKCQRCGLQYSPCCASAPNCGAELTCTNNICISNCGAVGQPCCAGNTCPRGGTCQAGNCVSGGSCGGLGQPCCSGNVCSSGVCGQSGCVAGCGLPGQACCVGGVCNLGTCTSGLCQ